MTRDKLVVTVALEAVVGAEAPRSVLRRTAIQDVANNKQPPMKMLVKGTGKILNSTCKQDPSSETCSHALFCTMVSVIDGMSICTMKIAIAKTFHEQKAPMKLTSMVKGVTGSLHRSKKVTTRTSKTARMAGPKTQNKPKVPIHK